MALHRFSPTAAPEFCIIAPTPYLTYFALQSTRHLALAHIVNDKRTPKYREFYRYCSHERGDTVIMDNGAFELGESYDPDLLVSLGRACGAHAIVLPDYPNTHYMVTIEAARKYIDQFKQAGFATFYVPQAEIGDFDGFVRSYEWAAGHPDIDIIGMSILNIPNALPHIPKQYARVVMTEYLQRKGIFSPHKYHHYLGLNAGPALEIPALIEMKALNSCDSSNPVWMAILGHEYSRNTDSYLAVKKVKKEVDFNYPWINDKATLDRIQHNINLTLELFEKDTKC